MPGLASRGAALAAALLIHAGCSSTAERQPGPTEALARDSPSYAWTLPVGFPEPWVPAANPMSEAKVELGRRLFYDTRLSGNGHFSCASCHRQDLAFTDGRGRSVGSTGELHPRGAMALVNVAYNATYNWADPTMRRLEEQALNPMFNESPVELGLAGLEAELVGRLKSDPELVELFAAAFPDRGVSIETIVQAIASFERTLISGNSPYDRYLFWGEALTEPAQRGLSLFFSERTLCSECHSGLNLSGPVRVAGESPPEPEFHNTGLFEPASAGGQTAIDAGVFERTGRREDEGAFRAPTLRNIAVTAPYMHDGSLADLEAVVDFYAAGGRGAGRANPLKSSLVAGFELDPVERRDLIAFLEALTDAEFLADPRFADPALDQKRKLTPAE